MAEKNDDEMYKFVRLIKHDMSFEHLPKETANQILDNILLVLNKKT